MKALSSEFISGGYFGSGSNPEVRCARLSCPFPPRHRTFWFSKSRSFSRLPFGRLSAAPFAIGPLRRQTRPSGGFLAPGLLAPLALKRPAHLAVQRRVRACRRVLGFIRRVLRPRGCRLCRRLRGKFALQRPGDAEEPKPTVHHQGTKNTKDTKRFFALARAAQRSAASQSRAARRTKDLRALLRVLESLW
jgi:hypothetical protein